MPRSRLAIGFVSVTALALTLWMSTPVPAEGQQATATPGDALAAAREAIWAKELKIYQGRAEAGLEYYLKNTSERYVGWPPGIPKPSSVEALRKSAAGFNRKNSEKLEMSLTDFTMQDGTAVIYYQTHRTMLPDGTAVDERFDVIHVWVREGADWKLIGAMARKHA